MDEIQRLRAEHDRNASREKGARVPRVRTDADRIKEKERSARRRREQTEQQREKERLRSLKRRRAMTPEQRKAASVKRVERRQHQRAAAAFPSEPLVSSSPLVGSTPPQYADARGPETDPRRITNAESASAEGASFAPPRDAGAAGAPPRGDLLDALPGADPDAAADPLGVLNAHPVDDDAIGDPAGSRGAVARGLAANEAVAEARRGRLEEERERSAARRARMSAEEKQLQHQARHARRQRAKAAGLEDVPVADPARVEGTLGGDIIEEILDEAARVV